MKRRWFLVGTMFLLVPLILAGCGISQEVYDAAVSDLTKAQQELQSARAEMETTKAQVSELTSSLGKAETELKTAQSELGTTKAKVTELTSSLDKAETELETAQSELKATKAEYEAFKTDTISSWYSLRANLGLNGPVLGINSGLLRDNLDDVEKHCTTLTGRLATLGDAELEALWEQAYAVEGDQWNLYFEPFEKFMAAHSSRIISKSRAITKKLP